MRSDRSLEQDAPSSERKTAIGQKPPVGSGGFRPASVIQNWLNGKSQTIERVYEIMGDSLTRPEPPG